MAFKKLKLWYDKDLLQSLALKIGSQDASFDQKKFVADTLLIIEPLEFKDRVKQIGKQIFTNMEGDYIHKVNKLTKILGPENTGDAGTFNNYFWVWPIASIVEHYGIDDYLVSINFIKEITKRSTGEFAIRPFLEKDPKKILDLMNKWSHDSNFHVRRLSSEGIRPLLPWAQKFDLFKDNPDPVFEILENLIEDSQKYVQKSVANHVNDYLKLNPVFTKKRIEEWSNSNSTITQWIIFHAIRNERKKGTEWSNKIMIKIGRS